MSQNSNHTKRNLYDDILKDNPLPSNAVNILEIPGGRVHAMHKRKARSVCYCNLTDGVCNCDPLGSYTGVCQNPKETPTQDADDL